MAEPEDLADGPSPAAIDDDRRDLETRQTQEGAVVDQGDMAPSPPSGIEPEEGGPAVGDASEMVPEADSAPGSEDGPAPAEGSASDDLVAGAATDDVPAVTDAEDHIAVAGSQAAATQGSDSPVGPVTVGRMIADALRRAGVRWAFTVPGESFLGLIDGLEAAGVHVVATRHEGAAAFMAEAHAQLTGRPAACLATRAVGASNLAIGIHTAFADSSPMFALVGQVELKSRGREGFQEVDLARTIGGLAKWSAEPSTPAEAVQAVGAAVRAAIAGRPGPVVLALAEDLLDMEVPAGLTPEPARDAPPKPSDEAIGQVLQLLASARSPVILAGGGILRARTSNDLLRLAELLRVPIIAAWRRGDVVSNDHPLYLGMSGYGAPSVVRDRLVDADAMLVIGCRLNEVASYGWTVPAAGTRWAHVDIAPVRPSPDLAAADFTVQTDAKIFLRAAVARLETKGVLDAAGADARTVRNATDRATWEDATRLDGHPWDGPGVHPGRIIHALRAGLPEDAILTTDAGSFAGWAARGFRFLRPGTFLGPTSGAMGYGLPAAIAAGLVHRDRPVVAMVGDGGLGMTIAELETAVRNGLRTIVVVFDNEQYGMIRGHQDRRPHGSLAGTDLGPVDWVAVARGFGARGARIDHDAAFAPALQQALVADRPTLLHLVVDRAWTGVDARP